MTRSRHIGAVQDRPQPAAPPDAFVTAMSEVLHALIDERDESLRSFRDMYDLRHELVWLPEYNGLAYGLTTAFDYWRYDPGVPGRVAQGLRKVDDDFRKELHKAVDEVLAHPTRVTRFWRKIGAARLNPENTKDLRQVLQSAFNTYAALAHLGTSPDPW